LIIVEQSFLRCADIVRRQGEQALGARAFSAPGKLQADCRIEANAGDHGHSAIHGVHCGANHLLDLIDGQRVEFACAPGDDNGAERVPGHVVHISAQAVEIKRKIGTEGRHRKSEDAAKGGQERRWVRVHV
jgi:hypothetical protein